MSYSKAAPYSLRIPEITFSHSPPAELSAYWLKTRILIGFLRLITIWPFPDKIVKKLGSKVKKIFVPEMNLGQLSREIERFVNCDVIPVSKIGGVPHTINEIKAAIKK